MTRLESREIKIQSTGPAHLRRRLVRLVACAVALTCVTFAISSGVASAGGAEVNTVTAYAEERIEGFELCGTVGTLTITSTYTGSTVVNDGGFDHYYYRYRDSAEFVPDDPTQTSYRATGGITFHLINDSDNAYLNTIVQQFMLHGSDGTKMRLSWLAPFVVANGEVRVNISDFRYDDCPTA